MSSHWFYSCTFYSGRDCFGHCFACLRSFIFLVLYCNNLGFLWFESPFVCVILGPEICKYGVYFIWVTIKAFKKYVWFRSRHFSPSLPDRGQLVSQYERSACCSCATSRGTTNWFLFFFLLLLLLLSRVLCVSSAHAQVFRTTNSLPRFFFRDPRG